MILNNHCPRCQQVIANERLQQVPAVCDNCGLVLTPSENFQRDSLEVGILRSAFFTGVTVLFLFFHIGSWGSYSLEIIPLKIGQWTHSAGSSSLERIAQIGMDLKKYDLVEEAYRGLAESVDPQNYVRLAKFQFSRSEFKESVVTYGKFFALGKNSMDARYDYAKALGEIGMIDEAAKNFDYVLNSKPGIRQVTVLQKYVSMLVKAQRYDEAQKVIDNVRRLDPSASTFMDTEYKVITEKKSHTKS